MGHKIVYKRYASLYFCCAVDQDDNELEVLEVIHRKQILKKSTDEFSLDGWKISLLI